MGSTFELNNHILVFDVQKTILLCKLKDGKNNLWIKKLDDIQYISDIIEDDSCFYAACDVDEKSGEFIAINRENGGTLWYIPGRCFFAKLYRGYLYMIFIDENEQFFFIKVDREGGHKLWHYKVDENLCEYRLSKDYITLGFLDGTEEKLSILTGTPVT